MASWAKTRGLSVIARREYVQTTRKRYRAAEGREAKSALLDELVGVAGFDRKYAITLMNQWPAKKVVARKKRSGRPRAYQHCLSVIEVAWEALGVLTLLCGHLMMDWEPEGVCRHGNEVQRRVQARGGAALPRDR